MFQVMMKRQRNFMNDRVHEWFANCVSDLFEHRILINTFILYCAQIELMTLQTKLFQEKKYFFDSDSKWLGIWNDIFDHVMHFFIH